MNMKTIVVTAIALSAATFAANSYAAADTATGTATVIVPIAIAKATDIAFGNFTAGGGGTVIVSTSNARTKTGTVILSTIGSTPTAAKFNVTGAGAATYGITYTPDATLASGVNSMALAICSDLTAAGTTTGTVATGTLTAGAQSIYVGGTLTVGATQVAGAYTGNVIVTVEYN